MAATFVSQAPLRSTRWSLLRAYIGADDAAHFALPPVGSIVLVEADGVSNAREWVYYDLKDMIDTYIENALPRTGAPRDEAAPSCSRLRLLACPSPEALMREAAQARWISEHIWPTATNGWRCGAKAEQLWTGMMMARMMGAGHANPYEIIDSLTETSGPLRLPVPLTEDNTRKRKSPGC
jgi:hypothetical protein